MNARLLAFAPFVLVVPLAASSDWPQWRGPSSGGVSLESALPTTWSATENIAWKTRLEGLGTSSPIVSGDIVLVTSQIGRSSVAEGDSHPQLARADEEQVGTVDCVRGDRIVLTKGDSEDGRHHAISCSQVDRVEGDRVILDQPAAEAKRRFLNEDRSGGFFRDEDDRDNGPHILNRAFSGTYER